MSATATSPTAACPIGSEGSAPRWASAASTSPPMGCAAVAPPSCGAETGLCKTFSCTAVGPRTAACGNTYAEARSRSSGPQL
eukprot:10940960-Lingulodinium_polyedra.AAC.1